MRPRSLTLIPSASTKIVSDIGMRMANLESEFYIDNIHSAILRFQSTRLAVSSTAISFDKSRLCDKVAPLNSPLVRLGVTLNNNVANNLLLTSNCNPI